MGNSSSGFNKTFVTNQTRSNKETKRPHSVLGISDDNNRNNIKSAILRANNRNNKFIRPPGMQLPPLPRSHSFHQVLRPTENGQILAAKGTIRGLEFNKPLSKNSKIGEELNAILNSRRCKSETDLATDNSSTGSNQSESSNYDENNKRKDNNNLRKSSASNGVAAKIHRAKYKAPQPPQLLANESNANKLSYENNSLIDSHKRSAKNIGNNFINTNNDSNNKNPLIRKLSDKSFNRLSNEESSRLLIIPRLRLSSQQSKDPGSAGSASITNNNNVNHVIASRYQSRNLIFDSKTSIIEGSNPILRTDSKQDTRKLRRSSSTCDTDINNKNISENALNERYYKTKSIEKSQLSRENSREIRISDNPFFKQLNSLSSEDLFPELHNHNNNNKYFDKIDYFKSDDYYSDRRIKSNNNKIDSSGLPPAFDDNFILRRSTPTAGLNEQKLNFFYQKPNQQNDKSNKNKSNSSSKRAIIPWNEDRYNNNPPSPPPLPTDEITRPSKSFFLRQHTSSPPPPPPINSFDYEFDISSANYKSIRTNVSDSANYSDEDEEEIKVILKPQLPPLKRTQLSDTCRERILLSEDLFNIKPSNHRSHCWTPLHDLSTSDDDDDGINSGNHSDDSIHKCEKELVNNSYDTRFTLKNQLRTLIHNNKLKQQNMFSY